MTDHFLAFGAGVQSSALALAVANRLPQLVDAMGVMPRAAIFADPKSESVATYEHLDRITAYCAARGFMVTRTSAGDLARAILEDDRFSSIPAFTDSPGSGGILGRNCTVDYKVRPIARKIKEMVGCASRGRMKQQVVVWLGISMDEVQRMKRATYDEKRRPQWLGQDASYKWQQLAYPLIEMGWDRQDCLNYLSQCGFEDVPKSACVFCPYRSDASWLRLKTEEPAAFAAAAEFDRRIRNINRQPRSDGKTDSQGRIKTRGGVRYPLYLHRSLKPLDEVELSEQQQNLFDYDCAGHCGL